MHGLRLKHSEDRRISWHAYFRWTRRTYWVLGLPLWWVDLDEEEHPITDFIRLAVGG